MRIFEVEVEVKKSRDPSKTEKTGGKCSLVGGRERMSSAKNASLLEQGNDLMYMSGMRRKTQTRSGEVNRNFHFGIRVGVFLLSPVF